MSPGYGGPSHMFNACALHHGWGHPQFAGPHLPFADPHHPPTLRDMSLDHFMRTGDISGSFEGRFSPFRREMDKGMGILAAIMTQPISSLVPPEPEVQQAPAKAAPAHAQQPEHKKPAHHKPRRTHSAKHHAEEPHAPPPVVTCPAPCEPLPDMCTAPPKSHMAEPAPEQEPAIAPPPRRMRPPTMMC